MKDMRQLQRDNNEAAPRGVSKAVHRAHEPDAAQQIRDAIDENHTLNVVNMPEYVEGYAKGTNPLTLEKLRRGEFSAQGTLDLHGFPVEEARLLFEEFMRNAVLSGQHCVKIIHGRGLKSRQEPVLKGNLKRWILRAMHRKWITAFASARMCDGGPGATYILLRKRPQKKRLSIMG
jgi:DNA-nicking Smr family endonuclease